MSLTEFVTYLLPLHPWHQAEAAEWDKKVPRRRRQAGTIWRLYQGDAAAIKRTARGTGGSRALKCDVLDLPRVQMSHMCKVKTHTDKLGLKGTATVGVEMCG